MEFLRRGQSPVVEERIGELTAEVVGAGRLTVTADPAEAVLGWIGGDGQPARTHYFGREFTDPFLDNWCLAPAQELHFVAVGIDADYVVATCRQACRRYAADVPKAENAYGQ